MAASWILLLGDSRGAFRCLLSGVAVKESNPEGPSTQDLRPLVPKTTSLMVFGTRILKDWVLGTWTLWAS